jgi:hypothetical protein
MLRIKFYHPIRLILYLVSLTTNEKSGNFLFTGLFRDAVSHYITSSTLKMCAVLNKFFKIGFRDGFRFTVDLQL